MDHIERIYRIIERQKPDRLPIWASKHNIKGFAEDKTDDLLRREIVFQDEYDWDMARISPAAALFVEDWGCVFEGNNDLGVPTQIGKPINSVDDFRKLSAPGIRSGNYRHIADSIEGLGRYLKGKKINLITAFSPLTLAQKLSGKDLLRQGLDEDPNAVRELLDTLTDFMIEFIRVCSKKGGTGLYFATQTANYDFITDEEFDLYEKYYDTRILDAVEDDVDVRILHLHGDNIMIKSFGDFPIDILNWADRRTEPPVPLSVGARFFERGLMGGMNGRTTLRYGTQEDIISEVTGSYEEAGVPFLVSPCCVIPVSGVPEANLHAFRDSVDSIQL